MTLLTSSKRQIYAQGDIDGACFLYSVVNAYIALTGKQPAFEQICTMVSGLKHPGDFLTGNIGTQTNYADILPETIAYCLKALGAESFSIAAVEQTQLSSIANVIDKTSVVLVHYKGDSLYLKNMNHWVCCVATEANIVHVACSVILQKVFMNYENYKEIYHEEMQRWSNDMLTEHTHIVSEDIYKISIL